MRPGDAAVAITTVAAKTARNLAIVGSGVTVIALVPEGNGGGAFLPTVIKDGVKPAVGSTSDSQQYDTFNSGAQGADNIDWIGYTFSTTYTFKRVRFQEGKHFSDGGFWDSFTVQVRVSGVWTDVTGFACSPTYAGSNGVTYESYMLTFDAITGDGIRLYGDPGGSMDFISVGELEIYES